jgi:hypothetical protein
VIVGLRTPKLLGVLSHAVWRSSLVRGRPPCRSLPWFTFDGSQHAHAREQDRPTVFRRFDQHVDGQSPLQPITLRDWQFPDVTGGVP